MYLKRCKEAEDAILECLRLGLTIRTACRHARINYGTYYNWQNADEQFKLDCESAMAEGSIHHAKIIRNVIELPKEVAHAAVVASRFYLSTHERDTFGDSTKIEHSGSVNVSLTDLVAKIGARREEDQTSNSGSLIPPQDSGAV